MSGIGDFLGSFVGQTIFLAVVFVTVFAAALAIGRRLLFPADPDLHARRPRGGFEQGTREPALLNGQPLTGGGEPGRPMRLDAGMPDPFLRAKRVLIVVFRVLAAIIIATLLTLTFLSYRASTPGTGDILVTILLAAVTLITFQHFLKVDRRHRPDSDPQVAADLDRSVKATLARKVGEALSGGLTINWQVGSPEVHRIDDEGLARARAMAAEGKSMDEICAAMSNDYAGWSPPHQQAFRNVMQAAIDQR